VQDTFCVDGRLKVAKRCNTIVETAIQPRRPLNSIQSPKTRDEVVNRKSAAARSTFVLSISGFHFSIASGLYKNNQVQLITKYSCDIAKGYVEQDKVAIASACSNVSRFLVRKYLFNSFYSVTSLIDCKHDILILK